MRGFFVVWVKPDGDVAGFALAEDAAALARHREEARWDVRFAGCTVEVHSVSRTARRLGMHRNSPASQVIQTLFSRIGIRLSQCGS